MAGHITDSLWLVAMALDKVMKECLGDPQDPSVIINTIETNTWSSSLTLSKALGSKPIQIKFDERLHRKTPMALGNLKNGTWTVGGVYDPAAKKFTELPGGLLWPKTNTSTPRTWVTCNPGQILVRAIGQLQQCFACPPGTSSIGGISTLCSPCAPGTIPRFSNRTVFGDVYGRGCLSCRHVRPKRRHGCVCELRRQGLHDVPG